MSDVPAYDHLVRVRGARVHNLANVDVDMPRDSIVAFTGVSGSGKSSLAFGTIYAEAQRRYFESVSPYARRLLDQTSIPDVDAITGLPPAIALRQRRGSATARSTVGTLTTLSNSLRMLLSRAGTYPEAATEVLDSDWFSPNTAVGACPRCHGLGTAIAVTEALLVPDPTLTIRAGAVAAWPGAWQGQNLRDILVTMGYDIDRPWNEMSAEDREWILFTEEQPVVDVHPEHRPVSPEFTYKGTFSSAERHIRHTLSDSKSERMREKAMQFVEETECPACHGSRLRPEAMAVTFAGLDIRQLGGLPLVQLAKRLKTTAELTDPTPAYLSPRSGERSTVAVQIAADLCQRVDVLIHLGLGHLSIDRSTIALSPGEMQRLRLATQLRSGLFGVVYVLDEPSAGLHPADSEPLLDVLDQLRMAGNSVFVVEHDMRVVRRADWVIDVGPGPGEGGGTIVYSGPIDGMRDADDSLTRPYLFPELAARRAPREIREQCGWICLSGINRHNLHNLDARFPLNVLTAVTGVSGSGKSTLVSQVLSGAIGNHLGVEFDEDADPEDFGAAAGVVVTCPEAVHRLVRVDQKPIGRTPRSNLATYTGMFTAVRSAFAATDEAKRRRWGPGRFSFNVASGRCDTCDGEGFVEVELLFLPGTHSPCPTCHGTRYKPETLEVTYRGASIADVLQMTVATASEFFTDLPAAARALKALTDVGLGYLRLGQPATELSGGEAQRIKLATELQRTRRGHTLYVLDEPTTGLHPADTDLLMIQLHRLVDDRNTVVVVEHNLRVIADADWVIDLGPGAGDDGGRVVAAGPPSEVAAVSESRTAPYLVAAIEDAAAGRNG